MKSLSLKVMTLLIAALVLSASGCFNDEMSSPEGTVKGYYRAFNQYNYKKMSDYCDPRETSKFDRQAVSVLARDMRKGKFKITFTDIKTTLVSKKESVVWKGDKWRRVKNENATLEVSFKVNGENIQGTEKLVLLDNKWYLTEIDPPILKRVF